MASLYSYTPLAKPGSQIRLLQIPLDVKLFYNVSSTKPLMCTMNAYDLITGSESRARRMLLASRLPYFFALSYVWGDPTRSEEIFIDEKPFRITKNLYQALRSMQSGITGSMHVWADAICINQEDSNERSAQIQLMRDIYNTAGEVRVWLGPATPETSRCLEFMFKLTGDAGELRGEPEVAKDDSNGSAVSRAFASGLTGFIRGGVKFGAVLENTDIIWDQPTARDEKVKLLSAIDKSTFHRNSLEALAAWKPASRRLRNAMEIERDLLAIARLIDMHFTQHPWFNRMWVVQELCCARDCLIQIGRSSLGWDHFVKSISYLHFHTGAKMENMRKIIGLEIIRLGWTSGRRQSLWDLIKETSSREATDARDKIYSLHGLMGDRPDEFLIPDYKLSVAEVFTRASRHFISQTKSLNPLLRWRTKSSSMELHLPSWVPDYSVLHNDTAGLQYSSGECTIFAASGYDHRGEYVPNLPSDDWATLKVRGILIDKIDSIFVIPAVPPNSLEPVSRTNLPDTGEAWLAAVSNSKFLQDQLSEENLVLLSRISELTGLYFEVFCQTINNLPEELASATNFKLDGNDLLPVLLDIFDHGDSATSSTDHLETLRRHMSVKERETLRRYLTTPATSSKIGDYLTPESINKDFKANMAQALMSLMSSRVLAVTEKRYPGAVTLAAQPGDLAAVLYGASAVCILRPLTDKTLKQQQYALIGEGYLHDFMNAEAIAMCMKGQLQEVDFVLR